MTANPVLEQAVTGGVDDVQLVVQYGGPAVDVGRMDARRLAPAMYSTAMLIEHSAAVIHGPTAAVKIDVNADFRHGSFSYELLTSPLVQDMVMPGAAALVTLSAEDIRNLIKNIGAAIETIGWMRKRPVEEVTTQDESVSVTVTGGENITVHQNVFNLVKNGLVREDVAGLVEPLAEEGIDSAKLGSAEMEEVVILEGERDYFAQPPGEMELLFDETSTALLQIMGVMFKETQKWRFARTDGSSLNALILDADFWTELKRGEQFGYGDMLSVNLRTHVERETGTGKLYTTYEVVKVLRHIPPLQLDIFPTADEPDNGEATTDESSKLAPFYPWPEDWLDEHSWCGSDRPFVTFRQPAGIYGMGTIVRGTSLSTT